MTSLKFQTHSDREVVVAGGSVTRCLRWARCYSLPKRSFYRRFSVGMRRNRSAFRKVSSVLIKTCKGVNDTTRMKAITNEADDLVGHLGYHTSSRVQRYSVRAYSS